MWRELAYELGFTTRAPGSAEDVHDAETVLGCALPGSLRALLRETDGLGDDVVLSAEDIVRTNREMRTTHGFQELYMPFEALAFFGRDAGGSLFAFRILAGAADDGDVFVWDHETDSRIATAADLERYVRGERWHERRS